MRNNNRDDAKSEINHKLSEICVGGVEKRGRFNVSTTYNKIKDDNTKKILRIIEIQSKQVEMLFGMIKNIKDVDQLFFREFRAVSDDLYEIIAQLKRKINEKKFL